MSIEIATKYNLKISEVNHHCPIYPIQFLQGGIKVIGAQRHKGTGQGDTLTAFHILSVDQRFWPSSSAFLGLPQTTTSLPAAFDVCKVHSLKPIPSLWLGGHS